MSVFSAEHYLGLAALGVGVGCYGTLIGAGGGFLLMPVLLLLYPDQNADLLTSISLAVVFSMPFRARKPMRCSNALTIVPV